MPAQIRPNRLDVNDRFPMLGFTIRTHGEPRRAEVVVGTDPALFAPEGKARRSPSNFYSSRGAGPLALPRGEAVYVLPPEVLARFVGSPKLYFGLATAPATGPGGFDVEVTPTPASPYVSLSALSGRSLRRIRVIPGRPRGPAKGDLDWAGDSAQPGQQPVAAKPGAAPANATAPVASPHYDDGFGPMPPETKPGSPPAADGKSATPNPPTAPKQPASAAPNAHASGLAYRDAPAARAMGNEVTVLPQRVPVTPPPVTELGTAARAAAELALLALSGPLAPLIMALRLAARASAAAGSPVSIGLGPSAGAGLGAGGTLGAGVIFGPGGEIGVYGSAQFDVGFVLSASVTAQITVVRGGIAAFGGWSTSAMISGGEGVVGGASALFDTNANFQGVSVQVGVGAGFSPIDFYVSVQRSVSTTLGMAAALGECGPPAHLMDVDPDTMGIEGPAASEPSATAQAWSLAVTPDYPRCTRFEASPAVTVRPNRTIDRIVIHITDANTTSSTVNHFTRADANSSAHYLVGQDGEVIQFVREPDIAWHAHGANSRSIGIEHVCVNTNGATYGHTTLPALPPSAVQYAESAALVSYLCDKYGIPIDRDHILGHSEIDTHTSHTTCPAGAPWDWDHYMAMVAGRVSLPMALAVTANLAHKPRPAARAFDADIPLDPGVGGQSIGMNALQVGDIILSTTDVTISRAIRAATDGQVSHAMLYVDQGGQVVEAVGDGVRLIPLGDAIASATVAVAFRVPGLTADQRQMIADAAGNQIGKPYNHIGIARQALFQIDQRLCSALPNGLSDRCRAFAGRIDMGTSSNDSFLCSELVLDAFRAAGQPLTTEQPNWASPDDIANLRFDFSKLRYIGHLKAAPSGGLFGHLLAYAANASKSNSTISPRGLSNTYAPAPRARARSLGETAPAARAIGEQPITRDAGQSDSFSWDLDQFTGFKQPANKAAPSSPRRNARTIAVTGWPEVTEGGHTTSADLTIDWKYDGVGLGEIRIGYQSARNGPVGTLRVDARIEDDSRTYQPSGCASLRVRLIYTFTGAGGTRTIGVNEVALFGDGTHEVESYWADDGTVALSMGAGGTNVGGSVATIAAKLISAAGSGSTEHTAWLQTKHPGSVAPPGNRDWKKASIKTENNPVADGPAPFSHMTVDWTVKWEYDGLSLRNIWCFPNVNTAWLSDVNCSVYVDPREARLSNPFNPLSPKVAVADVYFDYHFTHVVDQDENAIYKITLYGDGGSWQMPAPEWIEGSHAFFLQWARQGGLVPAA